MNKREKYNVFVSSFACVVIVALIEAIRLGNNKSFLLLSGTAQGIVFGQYFNMDMYIDPASFLTWVKGILRIPNVNIKSTVMKLLFYLVFGSGLYLCVFYPNILQQIGCGVAWAVGIFVVGFLIWYYKFRIKSIRKIERTTDDK